MVKFIYLFLISGTGKEKWKIRGEWENLDIQSNKLLKFLKMIKFWS